MSIILFLIILVVLVVSHEFGHFIVAKLNKIRVDEFSFGFPPKLLSKKIGETTYKLNALPFGGYVKIYGQGEEEEEEDKDIKRSYNSKPFYVKAMVLLGGVCMNFLLAWLLLSIGFMSGLPSSVSGFGDASLIKDKAVTITSTLKDSPAEKAGLLTGDKINYLETESDSTLLSSSIFGVETVQNFINKHGGEEVTMSVERAGQEVKAIIVPEINEAENRAMIGISLDMIGILKLPVHKAVWHGLKLTANLFVATVEGFYNLIKNAFTGEANLDSLTGPIGLIGVVGDAANLGFIYLLSFTALISINLVVINLIPFPALDGGQLLFLLIEKIKGSKIKPKIANWVNIIGIGLLIILMLVISYHDIIKLI
jgi:regulator of sigma E protease